MTGGGLSEAESLANLIDQHQPVYTAAGYPIGCQCSNVIGAFNNGARTWSEHLAERILAARADATQQAGDAVPESAHQYAAEHYVMSADVTTGELSTRPATWRDAPTTWGEAADRFAAPAREADPQSEGVGTGAGGGASGQDTGAAWDTRSKDCPEAPAQAHPLNPQPAVADDVREAAVREPVDGRTDPCPEPGYAGRHTAVGAGAISPPYRCHGCGAWFVLPDEDVESATPSEAGGDDA